MADETSRYDLGWNDGYAEGYACKLVDITTPFMPTGTAAEVDAIADWLMNRYSRVFTIRAEAIGIARGMIRAARGAHR